VASVRLGMSESLLTGGYKAGAASLPRLILPDWQFSTGVARGQAHFTTVS